MWEPPQEQTDDAFFLLLIAPMLTLKLTVHFLFNIGTKKTLTFDCELLIVNSLVVPKFVAGIWAGDLKDLPAQTNFN